MKQIKLFFAMLFISSTLTTWSQELPQVSPQGSVAQTVGLTNISISYSRPSVKERKIFGELVPFDKVWRLGANACTKIKIDQYLKFGDQVLEPGTYAMFATPGEKKWKITFNTNHEQWGTGDYDSELDMVTLEVKPVAAAFTETLEIGIENVTMNSGSIVIRWDKTEVELPFKVNTKEIAEKNITEAIEKGEDLASVYYNAAKYHLSIEAYGEAEEEIMQSVAIEKTFRNMFMYGKINKALGKKKDALNNLDEALSLAKKAGKDGWADYIEETLIEWKEE